MYSHDTIQVTQVENGWMVILPQPIRYPQDEMYGDVIDAPLTIAKPVIRAHDITALGVGNKSDEPVALKEIKKKNIFVFAKFEDVLSFLKFKVDE